jgi:hypothetical protein
MARIFMIIDGLSVCDRQSIDHQSRIGRITLEAQSSCFLAAARAAESAEAALRGEG